MYLLAFTCIVCHSAFALIRSLEAISDVAVLQDMHVGHLYGLSSVKLKSCMLFGCKPIFMQETILSVPVASILHVANQNLHAYLKELNDL